MPKAESFVWDGLRGGRFHGLKFTRQVPLGRYVADFVCFNARLVIELDGPLHDRAEQRQHDEQRDAWLREQGFWVLRFSNELILGSPEVAFAQIGEAVLPPRT